MKWENLRVPEAWKVSNREAKEAVAREIAQKVQNGQVIGVGSGSTSYLAILAIAERVKKEGLKVTAVCTSAEVTMACAALDLSVGTLLQHRPDFAFDGADEVGPDKGLIKGRGGALYLEKIVIDAAPKTYILVDPSKFVKKLGEKFAVPVEVVPMALHIVERDLAKLGATEISMRMATGKDGPIITEQGNLLLDVRFREIGPTMERDIKSITGVIDSGLFQGRDVEILSTKD
jgi:ribose 5-phosphate isomerase A